VEKGIVSLYFVVLCLFLCFRAAQLQVGKVDMRCTLVVFVNVHVDAKWLYSLDMRVVVLVQFSG